MEPPEPVFALLAYAPCVVGAVYAGTASALSGLPHARLVALLETLDGRAHASLNRYIRLERRVRARWQAIQGVGLVLSGAYLGSVGLPLWQAVALPVLCYSVVALLFCTLAHNHPERFAVGMLRMLGVSDILAAPLVDPLVWALSPLGRLWQQQTETNELTESEVEVLVSEREQSGALAHEQSEMIRNVLEFGDTLARDLMVPRTQVCAIELTTPIKEVLQLVAENEHSRYPVYSERMDNVVGILYLKDLFLVTSRTQRGELILKNLLRSAAFVPETQLASTVLQEMRAGRHHLSIVIDEYGGMSGIVTLEDLLEEIVGDIRDEYDDEEESPIVKLQDGSFLVDASMPIAELEREAGIELPDNGEYNSVGGFIVEEMGRVPEQGAVLRHNGFRYVIKAADERRVSRVQIAPVDLRPTG